MKKWNKTAIFAAFAVLVCASAQALSMEELLIQAAENRDMDKLQSALNQGADVNCTDKDGKSVLMCACENGWRDGVRCLLEKGAYVESEVGGKTPLMYAIQSGNIFTIRMLLGNGANVNAEDLRGKTALMYAIEEKDSEVVEFLLKKGADCLATDMYGDSIAMYAVKYKNGTLLKKLLKNSFVDWNKTNDNDVSPFALACMDEDLNIVRQILKETSTEASACRILDDPIIIWLIANKKSENIIRYLIESCSPKKILSMTDIFGHDIKYWAKKQGYWSILAMLAEIEEKDLR